MRRAAPQSGLEPGLLVEVPERYPPGRDVLVEAHVRVEAVAVGPRDRIPATDIALVIAVDVAASRRADAVAALAGAVNALPDGLTYTVLGGGASRCYPLRGAWAVADPDDRPRAAFSVGQIVAADARPPDGHRGRAGATDRRRPGGCAGWLAAARELFADREQPVRHLLLITDGTGRDDEADRVGRDDGGPEDENSPLEAELDRCEGDFTADVLALEGAWDPAPLLAVVERLHGGAAHAPEAFAPAVTGTLARLRRIRTPTLPLTVTARPAVRETTLTETAPHQQRITPAADRDDPRRLEFLTHGWEPGVRDYLLTLRADAGNDPLGVPLQLATVSVGSVTEPVVIRWLPSHVAATTGPSGAAHRSIHVMNASTEIRTALKHGYEALDHDRPDEAAEEFGQALRLAARIGLAWVPEEVRNVVEIVDEREGQVRIGPTVDRGTVRRGLLGAASAHRGQPPDAPAGPPARCPVCEHPAGPAARYCIACRSGL
ncbi:hypothetical protein [Streptomyces sp. NPDC014734]|uniref:hypothetical protein n=1 Tax=Streptomyces sp. NPDC014734 TaxID=3364886 RepID=UPI0037026BF8